MRQNKNSPAMKERPYSSKNISLFKPPNRDHYKPKQQSHSMLVNNSVDVCDKEKPRNFIEVNKKNLRNFFKDRIQTQKIEIGAKIKLISPTKIFKLRQQQFLKQQITKITLHNSLQAGSDIHKTPSTKKMEQTFHAKGLEKISSLPTEISKQFRITGITSYHTPTSNSLVKRTQLGKKQAYISVFGDKTIQQRSKMVQIESASNFSLYATNNEFSKEKHRNAKIRPKTNIHCTRSEHERDKLHSLLENIEGFAKFINPHRIQSPQKKIGFNDEIENSQLPSNDKGPKNDLVKWIKQASNDYKKKNFNLDDKRMRTVEDLKKLDPLFYQNMKKHKNERLLIRNKVLNDFNSSKIEEIADKIENSCQLFSNADDQFDQLITLTDRNIETIVTEKPNRLKNLFREPEVVKKQKLMKFGHELIRTVRKGLLFGIKREDLYISLIKKRKPYELQGSYAFFKLIKKGDIQIIKTFKKQNEEYLHQLDVHNRTTLIYSVQQDKLNFVKYFLKQGVNVDAQDEKGFTALAYSIINENYEMVKCLLQSGASPWSIHRYNINSLLEEVDDERIQISIKNARRVHIGMSMIKRLKKKQIFWRTFSGKISGHEPLILL